MQRTAASRLRTVIAPRYTAPEKFARLSVDAVDADAIDKEHVDAGIQVGRAVLAQICVRSLA